ncbi:MAG: flavodoxin [Oscillospiraceae bacterium]|jgi:flavodoxin
MAEKMLVVYYSWSNGNTKRVAEMLSSAAGADIAAIKTKIPYKGTYNKVVEQGRRETERGYMPEIEDIGRDLGDYGVIAVGTPTWWYTMAPAVKTFLHQNEWSGKTVIPFMTNGGWPGHVIKDMEKECSGAEFAFPMQVKFDSSGGDHMETPMEDVVEWTEKVKALLG